MNKPKIYISQLGAFESPNLFKWFAPNGEQVFRLEECDIVVFPGGADIHPTYYGEKLARRTSPHLPSDSLQVNDFRKAIKLNKFIVGICRGAQLACVMSGGKMIQHIENHCPYTGHLVVDKATGLEYWTNSYHHQMMFPYDMPKDQYEIIAYKRKTAGTLYFGETDAPYEWKNIKLNNYPNFAEPEIVYFPKSHAFGVQHHPEMMDVNHHSNKYVKDLIVKKYDQFISKKQQLITA